MKTKIILLSLSLIALLAVSCGKEDSADVSKVVTFPEFVMEGEQYITIEAGEPFTDPGVKAYFDGQEVPVTVTGSVNTDLLKRQEIVYTAMGSVPGEISVSNSITRYVTVTVSDDIIVGDYTYATAAGVANPAKSMTISFNGMLGKYSATDLGNQGTPIPVTFDLVDGKFVMNPEVQDSPFGPFSVNSAVGEMTIVDGFIRFPFIFVSGTNTGYSGIGHWLKK